MKFIGKFFNPANFILASSTSDNSGSGSRKSNYEGGTACIFGMFKLHPKGFNTLFFVEMWERFGFYTLMAGLFASFYNKLDRPVFFLIIMGLLLLSAGAVFIFKKKLNKFA